MFRGNIIAQIIAIIASIYLAKLYGANAYGLFGSFISTLNIITIINTLQLDNGIIISKSKKSSYNWFYFLILLIPIISVLTCLIYSLLNSYSINNTFLFFILITSIVISYNKSFEALLTHNKKFNDISNGKIILALSNITLQFYLYKKLKTNGLIVGFLGSGIILLIYYLIKSRFTFKFFNKNLLIQDLKSNNSLIKYLLPSSTINGFAIHLMPILIFATFSAKEAGEYFLSLKILSAPLFLISNSISQVFYKKSSDLFHSKKNELFTISKRIILINTFLIFIFILILNTIGIEILELFFKKDWNNLKAFIFYISFLIIAKATFNPISSLIVVLNKNHIGLIFNIYLLVVNLISIYLGYTYDNIFITIISSTIFGSIGYLFLLTYFLIYLKKLQNV